MAPHLLLQLGVLDLRDRTVVEQQRRVLAQLLAEVADVLQHLLHHVLAHLVLPDHLGRVEVAQQLLRELLRTVVVQQADHRLGQDRAEDRALADRHLGGERVRGRAELLLQVRVAQQRADLQEVAAGVGQREEEHARQVQLAHRVLVVLRQRVQHRRRVLHQRRVVHQHQLRDVRQVLALSEHALGARDGRLQHALRGIAGVPVHDEDDDVQHRQRARHRLQVARALHQQLPAQLADRVQRRIGALLAAHLRGGRDQPAL